MANDDGAIIHIGTDAPEAATTTIATLREVATFLKEFKTEVSGSFGSLDTGQLEKLAPVLRAAVQAAEPLARSLAQINEETRVQARAGQVPSTPYNRSVQAATKSALPSIDTAVQSALVGVQGIGHLDATSIRAAAAKSAQSTVKQTADAFNNAFINAFPTVGRSGLGSAQILNHLAPTGFLKNAEPQSVTALQSQLEAAAAESLAAERSATAATKKKAAAQEAAADAATQQAEAIKAETSAGGAGRGGGRKPPAPPAAAEPPEGELPSSAEALQQATAKAKADLARNRAAFDDQIKDQEATRLGSLNGPYSKFSVNTANDQFNFSHRDIGPLTEGGRETGELYKVAEERYFKQVEAADAAIAKQAAAADKLAQAQEQAADAIRRDQAQLLAQVQAQYKFEDAQAQLKQLQRRQPAGDQSLSTLPGNRILDESGQQPRVFQVNARQATAVELNDAERDAAVATRQITLARRQEITSARELDSAIKEQSKKGILNNFLTGISNSGFGGGPSFNGQFDGLARSAGQAVKYNALYSVMGLLQQAAGAAAKEFLDMDDSITELQVAMGDAADISSDFTGRLQNFASLGGFNVGEAMDVAARGVRAFRSELEQTDSQLATTGANTATLADRQKQFGEDFAKEAARLAVLATTTLTDSAGNLAAVAKGFQLPTSGAGLRQVTDAVAGAKLAAGGDETQIYQGLANSAVVFQNMGFSLRESATIISQLNAETDQSGQLLATRVARLGQILEGSAGKDFLRQVNQNRPAGTTAVDPNATARDQIIALSELYQKMDTAQRQVLTSRLGGTSQAREILILLDKLSGANGIIAKAGDQSFDNAGAREFDRRLTNVRAQLTIIQGNIKAIVTNLAASGLADPFVTLVEVLRVLTTFLKDTTQLVAGVAQAFGPFKTIAADVVALGLALKVITAIRSAGSIGGAILAAEGRVAPVRALARTQRAKEAAEAVEEVGSVPANAAVVRARTILASQVGIVDNAQVENAARDLEAAAVALQEAETQLATATAEGETAAIEQAQIAKAKAETNVARTGGVLTAEQQARAPFAAIDARTATNIRGALAAYEEEIAEGTGQLKVVQAKMAQNGADLAVLGEKETAIRAEMAASLERYEAREIVIRAEQVALQKEALLAARTGAFGNFANAATGGVVGRTRLAEEELASVPWYRRFRSPAQLGEAAIKAGSSALDAVGGVAGATAIGVIIAGTVGFKLSNAFGDVQNAQQEAARAAAADYGTSAEALRKAADEQIAAAGALTEAGSGGGLFGQIADKFSHPLSINPTTGATSGGLDDVPGIIKYLQGAKDAWNSFFRGAASDTTDELTARAAQLRSEANVIEATRKEGASSGTVSGLANSLDFTSVDSLTTSLTNLHNIGYKAATIMDALTTALKGQVDFVAGRYKTTALAGELDLQTRRDLVTASGNLFGAEVDHTRGVYQGIFDRFDKGPPGRGRENVVSDYAPGGNIDPNNPNSPYVTGPEAKAGLTAIDKENVSGLRPKIEQATAKFLSDPNLDLNAAGTRDAYEKVIEATLKTANLPETVRRAIANAQADNFIQAIKTQRSALLADPTKLLEAANAVPLISQFAGQEAANQAKHASAISGNPVDRSVEIGAQSRLASAQASYNFLVPLLKESEKDNPAQADAIEASIRIIREELNNAQDAALDALAVTARNILADNLKLQQVQINHARTLGQVKAIADGFYSSSLKSAVASGNVDAIIAVFETGSKAQMAAAQKAAADAAKLAKAKYDDEKSTYEFVKLQKTIADANFEALLRDSHGSVTPYDLADAKQKKDAADAIFAGLAAPNAGPANAASTRSAAVNAAAARANLGDEKQIAAAREGAYAVSSRDTLAGLAAAFHGAQVDLKNAGKDTTSLAYQTALKAYYETLNAYNDGLLDVADTARKASIDLSDPLAVANDTLRTAKDKLAADKANKASPDQLNKDTIAINEAQNSQESTLHQQRITDASNLDQLGKISHAAYLGMLQAEHSRIQTQLNATKKGSNEYFLLTQELTDTELKIKQAANELSGQFNLGDIRVPTVYEVRRSLANASAGTSTLNTAVVANTTNNNLTFNGADLAKVEAVVRQMLSAGNRYATAGRKV